MRQGKYHMKVRRVDDFSPAFVHPDFLLHGLTVWAVTVAAGIIMKLHMTTVGTLADVSTEISGFTVQDGLCCFFLYA